MKLASIFLTESAVCFRGFFSKMATNEREIQTLLLFLSKNQVGVIPRRFALYG